MTRRRMADASAVAIGLLLLGLARTSHAQSACTPENSGMTSWLQSVMDDALFVDSREVLGLSHLRGERVVPLLPGTTDDPVCASIHAGLSQDVRARIANQAPEYYTTYYRAGDRYLLVIAPRPPVPSQGPRLLPTTVVSLDERFTVVDAVMW